MSASIVKVSSAWSVLTRIRSGSALGRHKRLGPRVHSPPPSQQLNIANALMQDAPGSGVAMSGGSRVDVRHRASPVNPIPRVASRRLVRRDVFRWDVLTPGPVKQGGIPTCVGSAARVSRIPLGVAGTGFSPAESGILFNSFCEMPEGSQSYSRTGPLPRGGSNTWSSPLTETLIHAVAPNEMRVVENARGQGL